MLDLSHATEVNDLWDTIESKASLPTTPEEFFGKSGLKALEEHRAFVRHYLRCQGILRRKRDRETHAIYMKDCSRVGMGLISPVQLFPRERIQILMNPQRNYKLEVIRCRRLRENCYECGTIFILK